MGLNSTDEAKKVLQSNDKRLFQMLAKLKVDTAAGGRNPTNEELLHAMVTCTLRTRGYGSNEILKEAARFIDHVEGVTGTDGELFDALAKTCYDLPNVEIEPKAQLILNRLYDRQYTDTFIKIEVESRRMKIQEEVQDVAIELTGETE